MAKGAVSHLSDAMTNLNSHAAGCKAADNMVHIPMAQCQQMMDSMQACHNAMMGEDYTMPKAMPEQPKKPGVVSLK